MIPTTDKKREPLMMESDYNSLIDSEASKHGLKPSDLTAYDGIGIASDLYEKELDLRDDRERELLGLLRRASVIMEKLPGHSMQDTAEKRAVLAEIHAKLNT